MLVSDYARSIRDRMTEATTIPALLAVHDDVEVNRLTDLERQELGLMFGELWGQLRAAGDKSMPVGKHSVRG
jgi:hypothetical protein